MRFFVVKSPRALRVLAILVCSSTGALAVGQTAGERVAPPQRAAGVENPKAGAQPPGKRPGRALTPQQNSDLQKEYMNLDSKIERLYGEAKYAEAILPAARMLAIIEDVLGPDDPMMIDRMVKLAMLHELQANYATAEPLYKQSLALTERTFGSGHPDTAARLNNLAGVYLSQDKYAVALPLLKRALKIREKELGPDHADTAQSLNNLADLYKSQSKYRDAEPLYRRALQIWETKLGPEDAQTAIGLNNLAVLYHIQSNSAAAEPLYRRSLKIREKVLGPEHPDTATCLNNLAMLHISQANYAAAESLLQRSLLITEKVLGPDHPRTASVLNNLAGVFHRQGNYAAEEPLLRRALEIREKNLGPEHAATAESLNNLARLARSRENFQEAQTLSERALKINEKVFGPLHPATAKSLHVLASIYNSQGNATAAESVSERVLQIDEAVFGPQHPNTAASLNSLSMFYLDRKDYTAAESLLRKSSTIMEEALGPNHPETAITLNNLAFLYCEQEDFKRATSVIDQARRSQRAHVSRVLPSLAAREQALFLSSKYVQSFHMALSLALQQAADADANAVSAAWLINGKGIAQEALAQRNLQARDIDDPVLGTLVRELLAVRSRMATLAMNAAEQSDRELKQAELIRLAAQERQLNGKLGNGNTTKSADWIEISQVQEALPTDSLFVDIVRFDVMDFLGHREQTMWKPARYVAWITSPVADSKCVLIDLGEADPIDQMVTKVRQQISNDASRPGAIARDGEAKAVNTLMLDLSALSDLVWKPLAPHIGDASQLILSPDGALWLAPWTALPIDEVGEEYLLERYNLRLVVSGRDLIEEPDGRAATPPVILANPDFNQQESQKRSAIKGIFKTLPPEDTNATRGFSARSTLPKVKPLPNTGIEALAIQPHMESYTGTSVGLYKEQYALERVAKALRSPKIASFATHGFFLPNQEIEHEDRLPGIGDTTLDVALDTNGQLIENPLLRCGLLLSGCNNRNAMVGNDDGILTGMEITGIDFRGTELVVLSACETGVGDVRNGEGVAGLRQAFQLAGAEAVMATLWQIPDRESAVLMASFFKHLADGQSKAEALRSAQLELIEKRRSRYGAAHPFYWAAFTLTGR